MNEIRVESIPDDELFLQELSYSFHYENVKVRKIPCQEEERTYPRRLRKRLGKDGTLYVKWRVRVRFQYGKKQGLSRVFYVERRTDIFDHCCEYTVDPYYEPHHKENDICCKNVFAEKTGSTSECKCIPRACRSYLSFRTGHMDRSVFNSAINIFDEYDIENLVTDRHDFSYNDRDSGDTECGNHHYFCDVLDEECACTRRVDDKPTKPCIVCDDGSCEDCIPGYESEDEEIPEGLEGKLIHSSRCICTVCRE